MLEHPHHFCLKKIKLKINKIKNTRKTETASSYRSSDLGLRIQFNYEIGRWKTRWNMSKIKSEVKPKILYETQVLTNIRDECVRHNFFRLKEFNIKFYVTVNIL
jgi:hypothetical protein